MFHVKRLQTEETEINLFIDISEVQQVAIAYLNVFQLSNRKHATRRNDNSIMNVILQRKSAGKRLLCGFLRSQ